MSIMLSVTVAILCAALGFICGMIAGLDLRDYQARVQRERDEYASRAITQKPPMRVHQLANMVLTGRKCLVCGEAAQSMDVSPQLCYKHFAEAISNATPHRFMIGIDGGKR